MVGKETWEREGEKNALGCSYHLGAYAARYSSEQRKTQKEKNKRAIEKTRMQEREGDPDTVDRHSDRHAAKDRRQKKEERGIEKNNRISF